MAITNEPIMLNETGILIKEALDRQNGYLAMLAEGKRSEIYSSMNQIANLVRTSSLDDLAHLFPIGDQIIMPWKDMDDTSHNTDETAYQVAWDIVHRGMVTLQDGSEVPGLFIQMHMCSSYGVQFSHQQAFLNCPEGLVAGTYFITFGSTWGSKGASAGTSWQFTLTQDVPAGGRLSGFEGLPDVAPSSWKVKSWAKPDSAEPIETVDVTEGSEGTDLGMMPLTMLGETGLNCMQSVGYGHNRWSTSAIRQYLNSSGENWWKSKEDFDIRPDQYNKKGFMTGFGEDFLAAIKPVKVTTALNTVEGFSETSESTFDTFFLSHCLGTRKQNAIHRNTLLSIVLVMWTGFAFFHFGYILESVGATFRKHYNTEVKEGQEKKDRSQLVSVSWLRAVSFFLSMSKRFTMELDRLPSRSYTITP